MPPDQSCVEDQETAVIALSRKTARQPVTSRERSGHELIVTPRDDRSRSRADAARWEYVAPVWPTLRNSATLPGKIFNWFPAPWQWRSPPLPSQSPLACFHCLALLVRWPSVCFWSSLCVLLPQGLWRITGCSGNGRIPAARRVKRSRFPNLEWGDRHTGWGMLVRRGEMIFVYLRGASRRLPVHDRSTEESAT